MRPLNALVLLALPLAASCGRASTMVRSPTGRCPDQQQLAATVTNNFVEVIDIRANTAGRTTPLALGQVNAGERREFIVRGDVTGVYATATGRTAGVPSDRVDIRYECRK